MNKTAIKNFAVWAREKLIEGVSQKAFEYGIADGAVPDCPFDAVGGRSLTDTEREQRSSLITQIREKGFSQVMEEVAYTWFNRFIALRFMEVNGFLPARIRLFTDETGAFQPEILKEAMYIELDGLDRGRVLALMDLQDDEGLYRYLLITQCSALQEGLPGMFQKLEGYTELLFPGHLLRADSVLGRMVSDIPEEDWDDAVQIIGWLYQYYNLKRKDDAFALLKQHGKLDREHIPAATQLFTPDWIVRYLVENSLGRLWYEGHPHFDKSCWRYYLDEAEQAPAAAAQLMKIRETYQALRPEDIRVIDPCMGSGHILVYAFDVLMQIYTSAGWTERDAAEHILTHNLYGLDLDDRAGQLAYFAVMMKARKYNRRILSSGIVPNVFAIGDSSFLKDDFIDFAAGENPALRRALLELRAAFADAKELGSIISPPALDFAALYDRAEEIRTADADDSAPARGRRAAAERLLLLVRQAELLSQEYDAVITNPPYMGSSGMNATLSGFVRKHYPDSKSDLCAVFMERCGRMLKESAFAAMITQHAWMFLQSFEKLREKLPAEDMLSLLHLGAKAFEEIGGEVVQTAAFVRRKSHIKGYQGSYCRLVEPSDQQGKEALFLSGENRYVIAQDCFSQIPGCPVAYWVSDAFISSFSKGLGIERFGRFTGSQNITGDNTRFLRFFWEVEKDAVNDRWRFYAKGGAYRQYYGNLELVVDWSEEARRFYQTNPTSNLLGRELWFKEGITYSAVTGRGTGFRYLPPGCLFDKGGPSIQVESHLYELLALLNSNVARYYFRVLNPSINLQVKDIKRFPILLSDDPAVPALAEQNLALCKADWDAFEPSWDFKRHPLIPKRPAKKGAGLIADQYKTWEAVCEERFRAFQANQEQLNRIFIDTYGLQDVLSPALDARDITVRRADLQREVRSLISYAVGCLFGRYSLDAEGIVYAGGDWDAGAEQTVIPAADNILPIGDDSYFDDDLTARFIDFLRSVYGEEALEENLRFIADALGGKGAPREVIRGYFLNGFYADHLKMYQRRPIYWLFDSGKNNGFKALIYLHRYKSDLLARMRTDYVHEQQERYRTQLSLLEEGLVSADASERVRRGRQMEKLRAQALELKGYEEKIHHLADQRLAIDLNKGVRDNLAKFSDVLAAIK